MTIEIPLTRGQIALIDDVDADLADLKWYAAFHPNYAGGGAFTAARYIYVTEKRRKQMFLHRIIISRILNRDMSIGETADHVDGNPLNNRRENLRLATFSQNNANQTIRRDNTSGFKGVSYHKKTAKWTARISVNGQRKNLGLFLTPHDAAEAYEQAALEYFGAFARFS